MGPGICLSTHLIGKLLYQKRVKYSELKIICQRVFSNFWAPKGQLISIADWRAIDSHKKQMAEFELFFFFTLYVSVFLFGHETIWLIEQIALVKKEANN